jgi:hypothetical protein
MPVASGATDSDGVVHPVVGFLVPISGHPGELDFSIIGASVDGEWFGKSPCYSVVSPEQYIYDFYSAAGFLGKNSSGSVYMDSWNKPRHSVTLDFDPGAHTEGDLDRVFGIYADWNPLPRVPITLDPDQEILREAVRKGLQIAKPEVEKEMELYIYTGQHGHAGHEFYYHDIATDPVLIQEALSVDLDNDGQQETILSALVGDTWRSDHYGVVFPVLVNGDDVIPLSIFDLDVLIKTDLDEENPRVLNVLDANGDGLMEIVIAYGCCAGTDCDFITLHPDGTITKHTFDTDRFD